jgi:hypothetical protein
MATAMVEPSTADIAPPEPEPEAVATLPEPPPDAADAAGGPLVDVPAAAEQPPAAPGETPEISASAKAKLIGELQALKKRPGVAPAAASSEDCPEGSIEPQCLAAAD